MQSQALDWLKNAWSDPALVVCTADEDGLDSQLRNCMERGLPLLVTHATISQLPPLVERLVECRCGWGNETKSSHEITEQEVDSNQEQEDSDLHLSTEIGAVDEYATLLSPDACFANFQCNKFVCIMPVGTLTLQ